MVHTRSHATASRNDDHPLEFAFSVFFERGDRGPLVDYLLSRSNLPGPRANLEVLKRFAENVERGCREHGGKLWELCVSFVQVPKDKAVAGGPIEFIPLCGTVGLAALAAPGVSGPSPYFPTSMEMLKQMAGDPRVRVREAVAIALQRIVAGTNGHAVPSLAVWVEPQKWLQMRAVAAAVAEPSVLGDAACCRKALELHHVIMENVVAFFEQTRPASLSSAMRSEPLRKLVQSLEYSISVVAAAEPAEGFAFLTELTELAAAEEKRPGMTPAAALLRRIVKGNLRKKRLAKLFPDETRSLLERLS